MQLPGIELWRRRPTAWSMFQPHGMFEVEVSGCWMWIGRYSGMWRRKVWCIDTNVCEEVTPSIFGATTGRLIQYASSHCVHYETFCTRPDRSWDPPSLLYNGYRVSFPGVKRPGRGVNHQPPYSAEVKERVELYLMACSRPISAI
jgi:hypothetical protein